MARWRHFRTGAEEGFTLIEAVISTAVLATAVFSLTFILVNSLADTAFARQRTVATNLANQAVEEIRSIPWAVSPAGASVEGGMSATDLLASTTACATSGTACDQNITTTITGDATADCFEGQPLDVGTTLLAGRSAVGSQECGSPPPWVDPGCLSESASSLSAPPAANSLVLPEPIQPHQACYSVGGITYGIDVYVTGLAGAVYTSSSTSSNDPLTATVVVSWGRPFQSGVSDHVVTTTELSPCLKGGAECSAN